MCKFVVVLSIITSDGNICIVEYSGKLRNVICSSGTVVHGGYEDKLLRFPGREKTAPPDTKHPV